MDQNLLHGLIFRFLWTWFQFIMDQVSILMTGFKFFLDQTSKEYTPEFEISQFHKKNVNIPTFWPFRWKFLLKSLYDE